MNDKMITAIQAFMSKYPNEEIKIVVYANKIDKYRIFTVTNEQYLIDLKEL